MVNVFPKKRHIGGKYFIRQWLRIVRHGGYSGDGLIQGEKILRVGTAFELLMGNFHY